MQERNESLDSLRGFAILAMILSGAIAYGSVLPAWMFHAQVPPPNHKFDPSIPGITWVDLVFPFFLFSMGAAIPLSLKKYIDDTKGMMPVMQVACKRFLLLAFFALFTQHMKAWVIAEQPTAADHLLSMLAFVLLFFQFYENKNPKFKLLFTGARIIAFVAAFILLWKLPFWNGKGFDFYKSDIIILVLANMALFGTIIYYITADKPLLRIGLLPFLMAIFLAAKEPADSWTKELFYFSAIGNLKFDWLYKFYFLKYLFILIPGTFAGELMLRNSNLQTHRRAFTSTTAENILALTLVLLVLLNLYGLFIRMLFFNFIITFFLCIGAFYLIRHAVHLRLYKQFLQAGVYLLLLGLCFESFEGGIKKDPSTYSYYFVTSGLAFFCLIIFSVMSKRSFFSAITTYFSLNGKNPMVAYVTGNLLLLPLLQLTHTKQYWDTLNQHFFMGLMKGILFTAVVSLITIFFVRRKWFWKT